jgi:hypothetical protein
VNLSRIGALRGVEFAGAPAGLEGDEPRRVGEQREVRADGISVAEPSTLQQRETVLSQADRLRSDLGRATVSAISAGCVSSRPR